MWVSLPITAWRPPSAVPYLFPPAAARHSSVALPRSTRVVVSRVACSLSFVNRASLCAHDRLFKNPTAAFAVDGFPFFNRVRFETVSIFLE